MSILGIDIGTSTTKVVEYKDDKIINTKILRDGFSKEKLNQFINENNPMQYRFVGSIVAEVVSLTNECLLSNYLAVNGKTKQEKLAGIANMLGVIANNLFDAVREGKIEQEMYKEVHKGGMVTKDLLDRKAKSSLKKYYGPSVKIDKYASKSYSAVHEESEIKNYWDITKINGAELPAIEIS